MRGKTTLNSKIHSCSALEDGNRKLLEVKKEAEQDQELKKKIQDWP